MTIESEDILWGKYNLFVPKNKQVSKQVFHSLYNEYKSHPEKKQQLLNKLKNLTMNKKTGGRNKTRRVVKRRKHHTRRR